MGYPYKISFVLFLCVSCSICEGCDDARTESVAETDHCLGEVYQDGRRDEQLESKHESESSERISLNNDPIVESSTKSSPIEEAIERTENDESYDDNSPTTTQYQRESYMPSGGKGVYENSSSEIAEVLAPDHKEGGGTVTDQPGNKSDADINQSENKTDITLETLETEKLDHFKEKRDHKSTGVLPSDVRVQDFMKSRLVFTVDTSVQRIVPERLVMEETLDTNTGITDRENTGLGSPQKFTMEDVTNSANIAAGESSLQKSSIEEYFSKTKEPIKKIEVGLPQRLTMEETIGDFWKKDTKEDEKIKEEQTSFNKSVGKYDLNSHDFERMEGLIAMKQTMDENEGPAIINISPTKTTGSIEFPYVSNHTEGNKDAEMLTTDTTSSTNGITGDQNQEELIRTQPLNKSYEDYKNLFISETYLSHTMKPFEDHTFGDHKYKSQETISLPEQHPMAERLYSFNLERDVVEQNLNDNFKKVKSGTQTENSLALSLRDYEDKSEEDRVVIKGLLSEYSNFKKEKIEPGVLFEDCPDCDLRVLPIRPSEQRSTPNVEVELPSAKIRFADLPEGRELQINSLGLSDGFFFFSYLSEFLSWIQPNEFPVELLRDALRSQITWIGLITQSLQVEAGFVACLIAGVLLALAVPVVVLSHACYRMGGRDHDQEGRDEAVGWAGNCRRRTLVFILQLLLILLFAGMVAMFVTNEQLSSAVVQSSDVLQTSLSDVSAFVQNSHLQLHFLVTQSLDQALQAIYADLDNVDSLLGRPIQQELVRETGLDVALDSLNDLTREAKMTTQQVERFLDEARVAQEMLVSSREKLVDLRQQVELFRRACGPRDRLLCDTIDATGLDITLRVDRIKSDERLNRMRRMGGIGLEVAAREAKERFMAVPSRVDSDTRDAREAVRRQTSRLRAEVEDRSLALEQVSRDISGKVNEAKYEAGFWMQDLDQFEYWRWIICLGGGVAVLMIWMMLLCSMCCGCCGSEKAAGPTILVTIVLVCLFSTVLWTVALVGLLVGGHGEVFVCRPLYDEPDYHVISRLVDQPGVLYTEPQGGFIANVIYGNGTLDVPIKDVLQDCQQNRAIYPALELHRVFDVEGAMDQHRWGGVSTHLRAVRANLSSLEVLSPVLQDQLSDLLATLSVNFTEHRIQMSKPVTGKDLESFARQLDNIGNQMRDLATASRMETLSSRTRRLIESHIRPLEGRKDTLVYQLTALEVQTGPLQRQVNQSLSHLKTIQFFINNQGESIAQRKSHEYVNRLLGYVEQMRQHVINNVKNTVAPCRPLWDIFNSTRLFLCRHTMDPLNGYWFATMWCLVVLLAATPVCLKLVDYYRVRGSRSSGSPTENLMISEQGTGWSSPGYDIKCSKEHDRDYK